MCFFINCNYCQKLMLRACGKHGGSHIEEFNYIFYKKVPVENLCRCSSKVTKKLQQLKHHKELELQEENHEKLMDEILSLNNNN